MVNAQAQSAVNYAMSHTAQAAKAFDAVVGHLTTAGTPADYERAKQLADNFTEVRKFLNILTAR